MSGRSRLEACQEILRTLQSRFHEIDALCVECRDLIAHDDLIRLLSTVRTNFEATLSKVVTILDLPEEAAQTLEALTQETELVVVFEELVALDAKCATAQRLFEDGALASTASSAPRKPGARARNEEHKQRVASYFQKVDAARFTFEDRMWAQLREAVHLGDTGAATCVRVLRVVQEQEAMDGERSAQKAGALPYAQRRYRQLAVAAVEQAVDERCAALLPAKLEPRDGDEEIIMAEVLLDVQECFKGLEARPWCLCCSSFKLTRSNDAVCRISTTSLCPASRQTTTSGRRVIACVLGSPLVLSAPPDRCSCVAITRAWSSSTTGWARCLRRPATRTCWTSCAPTRSTWRC